VTVVQVFWTAYATQNSRGFPGFRSLHAVPGAVRTRRAAFPKSRSNSHSGSDTEQLRKSYGGIGG